MDRNALGRRREAAACFLRQEGRRRAEGRCPASANGSKSVSAGDRNCKREDITGPPEGPATASSAKWFGFLPENQNLGARVPQAPLLS